MKTPAVLFIIGTFSLIWSEGASTGDTNVLPGEGALISNNSTIQAEMLLKTKESVHAVLSQVVKSLSEMSIGAAESSKELQDVLKLPEVSDLTIKLSDTIATAITTAQQVIMEGEILFALPSTPTTGPVINSFIKSGGERLFKLAARATLQFEVDLAESRLRSKLMKVWMGFRYKMQDAALPLMASLADFYANSDNSMFLSRGESFTKLLNV